MAITLYTLPDCAQCETTKLYLEKNQLAYTTVDLSQNPKEYDVIKSLGYDRVPVVIAGDAHWSGFRPDKLYKLTKSESA